MRTHLKRKQVDDVLGGKESWANVDKAKGEHCILSAHLLEGPTNAHT
jgi:hypothetical protein